MEKESRGTGDDRRTTQLDRRRRYYQRRVKAIFTTRGHANLILNTDKKIYIKKTTGA